jgi:hypothetical protein
MFTCCGECGKSYSITFDGKLFKFHTNGGEPCEYAGGVKDWKTPQIEIPSGVLVVANDFRNLAFKRMPDRYINDKIECFRTADDYAEVGIFHSFVGNSCPGLYEKDGVITVANPPWDEETFEPDNSAFDVGEQKASVCTDLWWWSGMDKDLYRERTNRMFDQDTTRDWSPDERDEYMSRDIEGVVEVEPGVYEMVLNSNTYLDGENEESGQIYATLHRVGDCKKD